METGGSEPERGSTGLWVAVAMAAGLVAIVLSGVLGPQDVRGRATTEVFVPLGEGGDTLQAFAVTLVEDQRELEGGHFVFEVRYSRDGELGEWIAVEPEMPLDLAGREPSSGPTIGFVIDPHVGIAPFTLRGGSGERVQAELPALVRNAVATSNVAWTRFPEPLAAQGLALGRGTVHSLGGFVTRLVPETDATRHADPGARPYPEPIVAELRVSHSQW